MSLGLNGLSEKGPFSCFLFYLSSLPSLGKLSLLFQRQVVGNGKIRVSSVSANVVSVHAGDSPSVDVESYK